MPSAPVIIDATAPRSPERAGWYAAIAIGLLYAAAIAALTFRTELSVNSDGAYLLSGALNLATGHGFIGFDGGALTYWAPLYSSLVAAVVMLGFDVRWGAWVVNAIAAFGIMSAITLWLETTVRRRALIFLGLISCAVLHPLLELLSDVHPDALLLAFCLDSAFGASLWLRGDPKGMPYGLFFAALAMITKYQGVGLLMGWEFLILMRYPKRGARATLASLVLAGVSALPLAVWLVRNATISGTLTGDRATTTSTMSYYLNDYLPTVVDSVTNWFLPESIPVAVRSWVMVAAVILLGIFLALLVSRERRGSGVRAGTVALVTLSAAYLVFTLVASVASYALGLTRYLGLLAPVLVMLTITVLDRLADMAKRPLAIAICVGVAMALLAVPSVRSARVAARIQNGRPGYQYGDWYAEIRPAVQRFRFEGLVLTNHGGFVWTVARVPQSWIDRLTWNSWLAAGPAVARQRLIAHMNAQSVLMPDPPKNMYFVEVFNSGSNAVYAADLETVFTLVPLVRVSDGVIWKLE